MTKNIIEQVKKDIELTDFKKPLKLTSVRRVLKSFDSSVGKINRYCQIPDNKSLIITKNTLMAAFPVVLECRHKPDKLLRAAKLFVDIWGEQIKHCITQKEFSVVLRKFMREYPLTSQKTAIGSINYEEDEQLRNSYIESLQEYLADRTNEAGKIINHLGKTLVLSQDELGRIFEVTGETVRRWRLGTVKISIDKLSKLKSAESALSRLLLIFMQDSLPTVIRREAKIFGGQRALDWIFQGRFDDVANKYYLLTTYQL